MLANALAGFNDANNITQGFQNLTAAAVNPQAWANGELMRAQQRKIDASIANDQAELALKTRLTGAQMAELAARAGAESSRGGWYEAQTKGLVGHQQTLAGVPAATQKLYNTDPETAGAMSTLAIAQGDPNGANPHLVEGLNRVAGARMILQNPGDTAATYTAQNLMGKPMGVNDVANPSQLGDLMATAQQNKLAQIGLENQGKEAVARIGEDARIKAAQFRATGGFAPGSPGALAKRDKDVGVAVGLLNNAFGIAFDPTTKKQVAGPDWNQAEKEALARRAVDYVAKGYATTLDDGIGMASQEMYGSSDLTKALKVQPSGLFGMGKGQIAPPTSYASPGSLSPLAALTAQGVSAPATVTAPAPTAVPSASAASASSPNDAILAQARAAIAAGANPDAVRARLKQNGIDDSGL